MTPLARDYCEFAMHNIREGQIAPAIRCLRFALRETTDRKAWSKLMLAIRELSRVA